MDRRTKIVLIEVFALVHLVHVGILNAARSPEALFRACVRVHITGLFVAKGKV
jgi:hypothetical protein